MLTQFNYAAGWTSTLNVPDTSPPTWDAQGYEFSLAPSEGTPQADQDGTTILLISPNPENGWDAPYVATSLLDNSSVGLAGDYDYPVTGAYFRRGLTATWQISDFIAPGRYALTIGSNGNAKTSGTVEIYAAGRLITTLGASDSSGGGDFFFEAAYPFQFKVIQRNMGGDFSAYNWSAYTLDAMGNHNQFDSGNGVPPIGYYWGLNDFNIGQTGIDGQWESGGANPGFFWTLIGNRLG